MPSSNLVKVRMCGKTDVGLVRTNNEDKFMLADLMTGYAPLPTEELVRPIDDNRVLLAVADGMGGANAGEVASALAIAALREEFVHFKSAGTPERLIKAIEQTNSVILETAKRNRQYNGMATTLTAVLIERDKAYIAEVGDSRAYIIRGGRIKQITTDQNWTELMIEQGLIKREAAASDKNRNIILQSLGGQPNVKVALTAVELASGDILLLCSDGLSDKVSAEEMLAIINAKASLDLVCDEMISLANQRGGDDNITLAIALFSGNGLAASPSPEGLISHIEVISVYDHMVDAGVRDTRKLSSELRGRAEYQVTMRSKSSSDRIEPYPAQTLLRDRAESLAESLSLLQLAFSEHLREMDLFTEWLLSKGKFDLPLQQTLETLKTSAAAFSQIQEALEECNQNLFRCMEK
ncbi:MAG: Stp1/IreP family PP2C-type Ser/Thr phosphatase [Acidobacteriota bacterium]